MRTLYNSSGILVFLVLSAFASSCTSVGIKQPVPAGSEQNKGAEHIGALDKIAADFVSAFAQVPGFEPVSTTVQIEKRSSTDSFVSAMHEQLLNAGYGIRWVNLQADKNLFQYRLESEVNESSPIRHRFELAVGIVELRRTYVGVENASSVHPVTPLYIRGADASKVVLNDTAFSSGGSDTKKTTAGMSVNKDISPLASWATEKPNVKPVSLPLLALPTIQNVFEIGVSNHAEALKEHSLVVERILTFPNDSLRLGSVNKQIIHAVVSGYNAHTDMFSVLGCSLGPTALKGGNAALALGRASRVKEALLFSGVEPDKILDEGCWAGDSGGNTLPKRGVILTLNRRS